MDKANPKDQIGSVNVPMHLWPEIASAHGALAMLEGERKYGRSNFRVAPVRASIYVAAGRRHLAAWFEGEDVDPVSGISHLGHILANAAILLDARAAGTLIDDRQVRGGYRAEMDALAALVPAVIQRHALCDPRHYTIADNDVKKAVDEM